MSGEIRQPRVPLCPNCGGAVMMISGRFQDRDDRWKPARFKCANCLKVFDETEAPELRKGWEEWVGEASGKEKRT